MEENEEQNSQNTDKKPTNEPIQAPDLNQVTEPTGIPSTDQNNLLHHPDAQNMGTTPTIPEDTPSVVIYSSKNKKPQKRYLLILLVALLVTAVGGALLYTRDKNTDDKAAKTSETQEIELLRVGNTEGPASVFFPDEGILGIQTLIDHQIYEGLVGYDNKKIVPLIAQSWTNPDQKTWVFKIRPNVKFHTGKAVKSAEIKAALEDLKKYEYWSIFVSTIESVEATGELEVTIKTSEPDALLLNRLSQAYISDISASDKSGNNGTGAYMVDTQAKNDELTTTLIPFDEYHGGRAKVRKLVFSVFDSDENLVKALKDDKIDVADTIPIPSVKSEVEGAGFSSYEFEAPGVFGLFLNQQRSSTTILKNKAIRLAIAQAMDRQGLIDQVGNKNVPLTQVIPKSLAGYDETISFPAFDIAAAKKTLTDAGYKNIPLEFGYIKDLQLDAPILIEQLQAAGFKITPKVYASENIDQALADLRAGKFDIFSAGYSSDVYDARDILGSLLGSKESTYPVYNDPAYDQILIDSDKEFDPVKRIELLQKANKHILDNLAWIPLRNSNYITYYDKDLEIVHDFNGGGDIGTYYRNVGRKAQ